MVNTTHMVAVSSGEVPADPAVLELSDVVGTAPTDDRTDDQQWDEEAPARAPRWPLVAATLAVLAVLGWSAFFGWSQLAALRGGITPLQASGLVSAWSAPVLLVAVGWLVAMRSSRREANRFGDAARLLSEESVRLETRLTTVNRELSLAREFIAAQSRDLESLGRVATERLSQHSDRLAALIHGNGAQIEAIAAVSTNALENMDRLRDQLPVIASSAKDVTNNIGNAGRTAHAQLQDMVNGFLRLNEFGRASERQVITLRTSVDAALAEFAHQAEQLDEIASQRFTALAERGAIFRSELDDHEIAALASVRTRADALNGELESARAVLDNSEAESLTSLRARVAAVRDEGAVVSRSLRDGEAAALGTWRESAARLTEELDTALTRIAQSAVGGTQQLAARLAALVADTEELDAALAQRGADFAGNLAQRREEAAARDSAAVAALDARLAEVDAALASRQAEHIVRADTLAAHAQTIAARLGDLSVDLGAASEHGAAAETAISRSLGQLAAKLAASRDALAGTDGAVAKLTEDSVRLLELIQASAHHSANDLPAAIGTGEERLALLQSSAAALSDSVDAASSRGAALSDYVIAARETIEGTRADLEAMHSGVAARTAANTEALDTMRASLAAAQRDSAELAEHSQDTLRQAIDALTLAAQSAVGAIANDSAGAVAGLADRIGAESASAIDKALQTRTAEAVSQLEQAAAHAAGVSREAAMQLRDQLAKVNELAGNLEQRVAQARQRAEEQIDHDFARRVALITESLNSNAIDIAKALSSDVTDTAWASYLRGDRGVFTRRAVRLLDSGEAKAVAQIYDTDRDFREHVSHYIHDFEAMLRQLLSTRDGNALGVTLLSSDMGKLYVALAQAIERLRA